LPVRKDFPSLSARLMTFTTLTFLIFLLVFFPLYWSLRQRTAQNVLIVLGSYVFYGGTGASAA
jgi:D-alanyl-lipoteichoic acid acyltransferase DltB (MBOAT superfamily)